jgi:subtilisin family serine protease
MPRLVVSHRRATQGTELDPEFAFHLVVQELEARATHGGLSVSSTSPGLGRRRYVFVDCDETKAAELLAQHGKTVIVEPLMRRWHPPITTVPHVQRAPGEPAPGSSVGGLATNEQPASLSVTVEGSGRKLAGVVVTLVLIPPTVLTETTDGSGMCAFTYASPDLNPQSLSTGPIQRYWTVAEKFPTDPANLALPPIKIEGSVAWWHRAMGIQRSDGNRGKGIRVGLIDSGVGPHPCLLHVTRLGSLINGEFDPEGGTDVEYHGTEVAGLIASRANSAGDLTGIVPGVDLLAIRVFPRDADANQADVAAAIDWLVDEHQVDLVNLSLSGTELSELEHDAIAHAYQRGTLCICAAGNNAGPIGYPAAYAEAVSVAALGKAGWGPPGSIAAQLVAASPEQSGLDGLFLAPFSSRGLGLSCSAPGLGIISTFPSSDPKRAEWGENSGTSLSAPLALGALAALLACSPEYLAAPRARSRADLAKQTLTRSCRTLGIRAEFQGAGLPTVKEGV